MTGLKLLYPAGLRNPSITMGKEGEDKKRKKKKSPSLAILCPFPHASSCFSSSACRRSHFQPFTFLAARMFAMAFQQIHRALYPPPKPTSQSTIPELQLWDSSLGVGTVRDQSLTKKCISCS
ncbi:hypothetical protein KCV07_g404, partial [Aureobasidium melanogenum]